MRIGHGYDVHRLVEGRALVLGGIQIPYCLGLLGHSDADVLTHAVMDALLGAAGLGDIGSFFPDSDAAYKDISSIQLLGRVEKMLTEAGWRIVNVDTTIVAQKPKLAAFFPKMRLQLAHAMGILPENVGIKATTEEGLGFTGRQEGMAAHAVCLLEK